MADTDLKNSDCEEKNISSRRSLLTRIWVLLGVIALAELIGLLFAFFKPRKQKISAADPGAIIVAGSVDSFLPGTVTAFVRGKFYLARLADGGFLALSRTCTHLGCSVPWDKEKSKFICPCHGSTFDIAGEVLTPPATRALDSYPVRIENGVIRVNIARSEKRLQNGKARSVKA